MHKKNTSKDCDKRDNNKNLEVAHPQSGSSSTRFLIELEFAWNLEMLVFEEGGKLEYPEKNLLEQRREPCHNKLNPCMASTPGFEPRPHWWEASALTTAPSLAPPYMAYAGLCHWTRHSFFNSLSLKGYKILCESVLIINRMKFVCTQTIQKQ